MKLESFRIMLWSGQNRAICFRIGAIGLSEVPATNYAPDLAVDMPCHPKGGLFQGYPNKTEQQIIEESADNETALRALVLHWKISGHICNIREL